MLRTPAPLIGALDVENMIYYVLKILVSAVVIASISELAKRNASLAALLAALPLTSLLAFTWMKWDAVADDKIGTLSIQIFWLVIPSLILFVALWLLLRNGYPFWLSLAASCAATVAGYLALLPVLRKFGVTL